MFFIIICNISVCKNRYIVLDFSSELHCKIAVHCRIKSKIAGHCSTQFFRRTDSLKAGLPCQMQYTWSPYLNSWFCVYDSLPSGVELDFEVCPVLTLTYLEWPLHSKTRRQSLNHDLVIETNDRLLKIRLLSVCALRMRHNPIRIMRSPVVSFFRCTDRPVLTIKLGFKCETLNDVLV